MAAKRSMSRVPHRWNRVAWAHAEEPGHRMRTPERNSTVAIHANVVYVHGIDVDCSLERQRDAGYLLHSIIVINERTFRTKSQPAPCRLLHPGRA
jgi:hypothetical protein